MLQTHPKTEREPVDANDVPRTQTGAGDLSVQLSNVWTYALEAAGAQLDLCALKTTRALVIAAFGIVAIFAMAILAGYGFYLLDGCFAYALSQPGMPVWLAPLVRGIIYAGLPMGLLVYIWHTQVGFSSDSPASASGDDFTRNS